MGRVIGGIEEERAIDRRVEEGTNGPRNAVWLHFDILESTRLDSPSFRILHIDGNIDRLCLRCQQALNCEDDSLERFILHVSFIESILVLLLLGYLSRAGVEGEEFIQMWQDNYAKMSDEDKNMLPLKHIAFVGTNE